MKFAWKRLVGNEVGEAYRARARAMRLLLFVSITLLAIPAQATSQTVRVDGNVYTAAGAPVTGTRDIVVKAYTASTGGSALWTSSTFTNTAVTKGRFSVSLDASSGLTQAWSDASGSLWFEITVGSDIVKPRIQAKGAMFAVAAATADKIRNRDVSTLAPATGDVLTWTGSAWAPAAGGGAAGSYVAKSGDTMTGKLTLGGATNNIYRLYVPWLAGDTNSSTYFGSASSSNDQTAVLADSYTGNAVYGHSVAGSGVWGKGDSGVGVRGASDTSLSGLFQSNSGSNTAATLVTRRNSTAPGDLFQAQDSVSVAVFSIGASGAVKATSLTASRLVRTDASQILTSVTANPTDAELGYLSGVTAPIQTQINSVVSGGSFVAKAGDTMTGSLGLPTGSASSTSLNFGSANTGLFKSTSGSGVFGFAVGGTEVVQITSTGRLATSAAGSAAAPAFVLNSGGTTAGLYVPYDGALALTVGGSARLTFDTGSGANATFSGTTFANTFQSWNNFISANGSTSNTAYGFNNAKNSGMYAPYTGSVALVSGGSSVLQVTTAKTILLPGMAAGQALYLDASTQLATSTVTGTELGYLSGVTAAIQTQINSAVTGAGFVAKAGDTMAGPLRLAVGTTSAPALTFGTTNTGLWGNSTDINVSIGGNNQLQMWAGNANFSGNVSSYSANIQNKLDAGSAMSASATLPIIYFTGNTGSGFTRPSVNAIGIATNSVERLRVTSDGFISLPGLAADRSLYLNSSTQLTASAVTGTELGYLSGVTAALQTQINSLAAGSSGASVLRAGDTMSGSLTLPVGSSSSPAIAFTGTTSAVGMYYVSGTNSMAFKSLLSGSVTINAYGRVQAGDWGNATDNAFAISNAGTGLFAPSSQSLGVSTGSTERLRITSTGTFIFPGFTADKALYLNASTQLATSAVSSTELGYLAGVTSALQTQINSLAAGSSGASVLRAGDTMTGTLTATTVLVADGVTSNPSISFSSGSDLGFYKASGGIGMAAGGSNRITFTTSGGISANGTLYTNGYVQASYYLANNGTAGTPVFRFNSAPTTGIYAPANGDFSIATAGTERMHFISSGAITIPGLTASRALTTDSSSNLTASSVTGTELGYLSGVTAALQTQINALGGGTYVAKAGDTMTGALVTIAGTTSAPAIQFGDTLFGVYRDTGAASLNFVKGGVSQLQINSYGGITAPAIYSSGSIKFTYAGGTPATPGIRSSDDKNGLDIGPTGLGFVTNNAERLLIDTGGNVIFKNGLTADRALYLNASTQLATAAVTGTQLGYLSGLTADVQTQINNAVSGGSFVAKGGDTMTGALTGTTVLVGDGTAAAPSVGFKNDTNTGLFTPGADTLALSTGGAEALRVLTSGTVALGGAPAATVTVNGVTTNTDKFRLYVPWKSGDSTATMYVGGTSSTQRALYAQSSFGGSVMFSYASGTNGIGLTAYADGTNAKGLYASSDLGNSGYFISNGTTNTSPTVLIERGSSSTADLFAVNGLSSARYFTVGATGNVTMGGLLTAATGSVSAPSINVGDADTGLYKSASKEISIATGGSQKVIVNTAGMLVKGQIYASSASGSGATINFNAGNAQSTSYDCAGGNITLNDVQDGGSYSLAVTSGTTAQCNFTVPNVSGTVYWSPANGARATGRTVYTLIRIGNDAYVAWIKGFQ